MSNHNAWVAAACGASALALVLSMASFVAEPEPSPGSAPAIDVARIERLEQSIDALDRKIGNVAAASRDRVGQQAATSVPADVEERLAAVEARVAQTAEISQRAAADAEVAKARADADTSIAHLVARAREPAPKGGTEDWQRVAVDRSKDAATRVAALRALRHVPGGRTRGVALAMRDLFHESDDADVRTDIIRQLSGVTEPELETWFVETLGSDANRKTREEAAENLADFEGSQNVIHALQLAAENDKNSKVRSECRDALDKLTEGDR